MNVVPKISHNPSCPWNFVQIPKNHKKPNLACIDALISSNFLN
ncbi:unnamed protein product, partial [Vitis vinifera]|uniref:Uncharacterized protein n=1 Tax=Vitis vinifera TaxID=29760 RepID=D7U667_VITVI